MIINENANISPFIISLDKYFYMKTAWGRNLSGSFWTLIQSPINHIKSIKWNGL